MKSHFATQCHKGGIQIKHSSNDYKVNPFGQHQPQPQPQKQSATTKQINLNLEEYSREDIFHLFGIQGTSLTEEVMKHCKKIVLKTHPDKSKLHEDYFLFFSNAYKKLLFIYEFQNKSKAMVHPQQTTYDPFDKEQIHILDKLFQTNKDLKKAGNFNHWFNEQFDSQKIEEPTDTGYGDWLNSEENTTYMPNISMSQMNAEMQKKKREVKSLVAYQGISDAYTSTCGGTMLSAKGDNFSSDTLFSSDGFGYSDLRQAYVESVIPVTEEDQANTFRTVGELKSHRDQEQAQVKPLSKEESMQKLFQDNQKLEEESAALAYYYATQSEKVAKNQEKFWSSLKQITW